MSTALDHRLLAVTADAVANALDGFSLALQPHRNMEWLATAVRRTLAIVERNPRDGSDRTSNADLHADLQRLSDLTGTAWLQLSQCDIATEDRIYTISLRNWDGEGGNVSEPLEYRRYKAALVELEWLSNFLRKAAMETDSPRGPWREKERKWLRIDRAHFLAPVFEAAYGQVVSANNYGNDARHKTKTAFMDFYERMVTLAFGVQEATNLSEVVKEGCKRHRRDPVKFDKGVIPGM